MLGVTNRRKVISVLTCHNRRSVELRCYHIQAEAHARLGQFVRCIACAVEREKLDRRPGATSQAHCADSLRGRGHGGRS